MDDEAAERFCGVGEKNDEPPPEDDDDDDGGGGPEVELTPLTPASEVVYRDDPSCEMGIGGADEYMLGAAAELTVEYADLRCRSGRLLEAPDELLRETGTGGADE